MRNIPLPAGGSLRSCWVDDQATPEDAAFYEAEQLRASLRQLALATPPALALMGLTIGYFWRVLSQPIPLALSALISLMVAALGIWALRELRRPPGVARGVRLAGFALLVLGAIWSALGVYLFVVGVERERALVLAVLAAQMASGAWLFSAYAPYSLSWVAGIVAVAELSLLRFVPEGYGAILLLVPLFGFSLSTAALQTSRVFLLRLKAERHLAREHDLVGLLLHDFEQNAADWLWEIDGEGRLRHVSVRLAELLGTTASLLSARSFVDVLAELSETPDELRRELSTRFSKKEPFRDLVLALKVRGQERYWSLKAQPTVASGPTPDGFRGVGADVTVLRQREAELLRVANTDSLTGLGSRHQFQERLRSCLGTKRAPGECTLFLIDLDNFKAVNDSLGHGAGDALLSAVGARLTSLALGDTLVARLGGDVFAFLEPRFLDTKAATVQAEAIVRAIGAPLLLSEHRIEMGVSIGIGRAPDDGQSTEELLRSADLALYASKARPSQTFSFYSPKLKAVAESKFSMLGELRDAIRSQALTVYYQPLYDLEKGALVAFEALVRWVHPERGMIAPAEFIPLAEDSGLIVDLGPWVLAKACAEATTWPSHIRVAVNVSPVELERTQVPTSVAQALAATGLAPQRLELELTESALLQDAQGTIEVLSRLRKLGVRIGIDDFGTGFSSLSYLRLFPLDKLKIDRSFVAALGQGDERGSAEAIVRAIHDLARALRLEVVAEGIETAAQADTLRRLGCRIVQGYAYGRPMPAATAAQLAHSNAPMPAPQDQLPGPESLVPPADLRREARRIATGKSGAYSAVK